MRVYRVLLDYVGKDQRLETMSYKPPAAYTGTCRFCRKRQEGKHMTALFSSSSLEKELPVMLSPTFEVPVDADDGISIYMPVEAACPLPTLCMTNLIG